MPLDPNDPEVRLAVLGEQIDLFLKTDIGQYVGDCAESDIRDAAVEMASTDPFNHEKIISLQLKIKVAQSVMEWLRTAIIKGRQAFDTEEL